MAIRQRKSAINNYYKKPNICFHCNEIINVQEGQKVSDVRKKKFCNHKCAAMANNVKRGLKSNPKFKKCKMCGCEMVLKRKTSNQGYSKKKYCESCLSEVKAKNMGADNYIANMTKKQVMDRYDRYYIGRNAIRKHANKIFYGCSESDKKCKICGYNKYIDVCHIKDVKDFNDEALIVEINDIDNLVALCPNHHVELDNELMSKEDLNKI